MIIPHGEYPTDKYGFNVIKMMPELFESIDFKRFVSVVGSTRFNDFLASLIFLHSAQFQKNHGAKLIMSLSGIERLYGDWNSLNSFLLSSDFKTKMQKANDGKKAYSLLEKGIKSYFTKYGSSKRVLSFYLENLDESQKITLVNGIQYVATYRKEKGEYMTYFIPEHNSKEEEKSLDEKLETRIKQVVYNMRNDFVHNAEYFPFPEKLDEPGKDRMKYLMRDGRNPKKDWVITIPFEVFHKITHSAYKNYWIKEYEKRKKELGLQNNAF